MVQRLGQILLKARVLTQDVLGDALLRAKQNRVKLGETLISMGAVTPEEVLRALAEQNGLPFVAAEELPSAPPMVKNLSPKYLRQYMSCPIAVYGASTPLQKIVEGIASGEAAEGEEDINHLRDMAFEAPVVRLVNLLIEEAVASEASDIYVEPFEDRLRVRYRMDGILYDRESPPRKLQAALTSRIKLMAEMNIAERRLPQDGRIRVTAGGRRVDIRVSTVPTVHGESLVMRLLDRSSVFLPFHRLGFSPPVAESYEALVRRPHGIL